MALNMALKALSMVVSGAIEGTTKEQVEATFAGLGLGELEKIDIVPCDSYIKIFVNYRSTTSYGDQLRSILLDNQSRPKQGERIQPVKIVYGSTRDGRDRCWLVYAH